MSDFETRVDIRYSDLDTYGVVNNAVYATVVEEARIDYLEHVLGDTDANIVATGDGTGIVVANLEIDFRAPLTAAGPVTVTVDVPELGRSSIPFECHISDESGDVVATAETTAVVVDRDSGESVPIPDTWRERITAAAE